MYKATTIAAAAFLALAAGPMAAADDVMVVFDGSNSMWGQIEGTAKIQIAREAMDHLFDQWSEDANVGLMAYGHRRQGDCNDIETMITPGPFERTEFLAAINGISPKGKTPLTAAVEQAAETLAYRDAPATVVLMTDGIESCQRDPCALARTLAQNGVNFTAHVVGFDLKDEEQEAIACLAEHTGGRFVSASNARELGEALGAVGSTMAEAPLAEPEPAPEPVPEPITTPSVTLAVPENATSGADFSVSWRAAEQAPRDYVTIVPLGADEGAHGHFTRVGDRSEGILRAPAAPGLYDVRYVSQEESRPLAAAQIEIVAAQASVEAPETATVGETFPVSWSAGIHPRDYVTIVPAGAPEGQYGDFTRVGDKTDGSLQAPADPGFYEVRYVLEEGSRTLATAEIEIIAAQASLEAPETATAGETFAVSWSAGIHPRDFVTIVPAGAPEGQYGDFTRVGDKTEGSLQAPADPGLYEVRYVLQEGSRTLASSMIEIVAAQVSLRAPESALVGTSFPVQWSRGIHPRDYVTIVAPGADEGTYGDFSRVGSGGDGTLRAPAEPGLYEVRYVLDAGQKTVASAAIQVVEADIELDGPGTVRAGTEIRITWSGTPPHSRDYVTLVPMGAEEGASGDFVRIGSRSEAALKAPDETGLYEIRYVLDQGSRILASHMVEVVAETAALHEGGLLEAPETGAPGESVEVRWTAENTANDQRVTFARPEQADFTWIDVQQAADGPLTFTLPEQPGFYEFRLLDVTARKVLSRVTINVE
ncbi:MAG TPA: VWA domain-containing protein [Kiloniellales bacterium]|nr:VWA domain-containing protein [Kiloniellales bacterium]